MGGLCAGLVPSPPEINISAEQIAEAIAGPIAELPGTVAENQANFKAEVNKCGENDKFEVPDTTIVLTSSSTDEEIRDAAIKSAFATAGRDQVKDAVWGTLEPTIDEQLASVEAPQKLKNTAKDKFREATIDPAVDKALDEAMAKLAENKEEAA